MNRRGFLRSAVSAAVGVALAPIAAKLLPEWAPLPIPPPPKPATDFSALSPAEIKVWSRSVWREASRPTFAEELKGFRFDPDEYGIITIDTVA